MSEPMEPKRKPGRPPKVTAVVPRTEEGTWAADDVLAQRLGGQPFGVRAEAIPLREPGKWQLYIANSQSDDGRHYDMVHRKGWQPFTVADLPDGITPQSIGFSLGADGQTLVRGGRGDEVVYKMPKAVYAKIQAAKTRENMKGIQSERGAREAAAEAAVAAHGEEAAEFLQRHGHVTVRDTIGSL